MMEVDKETMDVDKLANIEIKDEETKDVDKDKPIKVEVIDEENINVDKPTEMEISDKEIGKPANTEVDGDLEVNKEDKVASEIPAIELDREIKKEPIDQPEVIDLDNPPSEKEKDSTESKSAALDLKEKESSESISTAEHNLEDSKDSSKNSEAAEPDPKEIQIIGSAEPDQKEKKNSSENSESADLHLKEKIPAENNEKAEGDLKEIIRISAGASDEDDDEKIIHLTADEAKQYLLKKIGEYMNSPVNPLYALRAKAKDVEAKGKIQVEEYVKLYKGLQLLQRKHENFLRQVDILPKITMCHVNVSADLPMEPVPNPEVLLKKEKELSITKVENPPNKVTAGTTSKMKTNPAKPSNIECIDLTDEVESPPVTKISRVPVAPTLKHPAPLPPRPFSINAKRVPPKPRLKISAEDRGIVLQWDMPPNPKNHPVYDPIGQFEIFGYQEQKNSVINTSLWKKIGSVKSMSLPMACTLTQFVDGNKYHFAIRAVDANGLCGNYSDAISIVYKQKTPK